MDSDNLFGILRQFHFVASLIYRIVSVERLFELFASKTKCIGKAPTDGEDPFENFIFENVGFPTFQNGRLCHHRLPRSLLRGSAGLLQRCVRRDVAEFYSLHNQTPFVISVQQFREVACKPLAVLW